MPTSLVVEDNKLIQKSHKLSLEELGYSVDTAETGREALDLLETHKYDIILMDIGLPDKTGTEVIKNFRQSHHNTRINTYIIAITAYVDDDIEKCCFEAGCDLVLSKPVTTRELEEHLITLVPA